MSMLPYATLFLVLVTISLPLLASADSSANATPRAPRRLFRVALNASININIKGPRGHASGSATHSYRGDVLKLGRGPAVTRSREFVLAHNKVRRSVGQTPLVWDRDLARYARRWAAQRLGDCQMLHTTGPYGENIFWGRDNKWSPSEIVDKWVGESQFYDVKTNLCEHGQICGHYTQIVWKDTTKLGCARVTCKDGGLFAICVYDPPGNWVPGNPFIPNVW